MAYVGRSPSNSPLTSADIPDGIVTAADLAPDSVGTSELADSVTLVTPNLGTVATGNLSNSAIVYPDGHVIQVVSISASDPYSGTNNAFTDQIMTNPSCSITLSSATNDVLLFWSIFYIGPSDDYAYVDLKRVATGLTTTSNLSGETGGFCRMGGDNQDHKIPAHFSYLDSPGVADVAITYQISYRSSNGSATIYMGAADGKTTITAMEIVDS
jgi:hypothetical protein